jgi:glutathione synthase/RimK-type ligase-like ATP-grasp enzyme
MIIRGSKELKERYYDLGSGDVFLGALTFKHLKHSVLIHLLERGVFCFPSALSQILNHSKASQVIVFKKWMLPHTFVITRRADLIDIINRYNRVGVDSVVTKEDRMHCGHGIRKWDTIETVYSFMAFSESSYPFVVQPFLENFTDVRVIIAGDYMEAYVRYNPNNFRMNLSLGGQNHPYEMDKDMEQFCRDAMEHGKFPYAHMDLLITDNIEYYLSEIALNGGIKGARISRKELDQKKHAVIENLAAISLKEEKIYTRRKGFSEL